jgi:hypothetical protein
MHNTTVVSLGILFCAAAWAADDMADREKLMGQWQMEAAGVTWSFIPQGDSVKVTEVEGGSKVADFICNTEGTPCDVKISGKKASVSLWYNGGKLVELEQKGSETVRRRFTIAPATADQMELEVVQIAPAGKNETLKFKRSAAAK